ncbi:hypothetical protein AC564_3108 [Lacticaseibacillus paracasei]|nr:hypothetical protein AC564_3108 [Lacticaseibacillus paracasei]
MNMKAPNPLSKMFAANHFTMIGAENSMATLFEPITKNTSVNWRVFLCDSWHNGVQ